MKTQPLSILLGAIALFALPSEARAPKVDTADAAKVIAACRQPDTKVLTFAGYSGAGYESADRMLEEAAAILDRHDRRTTVVNIGATEDGIGAVYALARKKGFRTMGIVSSQARANKVPFSPSVERVFVVPDKTWGGRIAGTERLSPTSLAMFECSDAFVAIGGGDVARDEFIAARQAGKEVRFIPADMNHRKAIEAARRKGIAPPTDFSGSAGAALAR